jgi:hypothetical protein
MQILARVELETDVDAEAVSVIEQRSPARRQRRKAALDQAGRGRRIGVEERPEQAAREGRELAGADAGRERD